MSGSSLAAQKPAENVAVVVIHGVGETETGWINDYIVDPLSTVQPQLMAMTHSELHRLDEGEADARRHFMTLMRRMSRGADHISFAELIWADISRVGRGYLNYVAATIKLLFEMPDVLAHAFLRNRRFGIHWVIGNLVLTASRLLKWFVIGLSLVLIACALYMAAAVQAAGYISHTVAAVGFGQWTASYGRTAIVFWLAPLLLLLAGFGIRLLGDRRNRDIGLSEFGLGLAISSLLALAYFTAEYFVPLDNYILILKSEAYFDNGRRVMFAVWVAWCIATVLAIALLALVWLGRQIGLGGGKNAVPLHATWGAIFNILVQAIILKLIIFPLVAMSCLQLRGPTASTVCDLRANTGAIFFSLFEIAMLAITGLWILHRRSIAVARNAASPETVPRLIVSPVLVAMAVIAVLMHISVFAGDVLQSFPDLVYHSITVSPWLNYDIIPPWLQTAVVAAIPAYLFLLRVFHSISAPIVHIARELVDHQYRPRSTELHAIEKRLGHGRSCQPEYPRRALIEARLDAVMEKLVTREPIDKLIFLTHSQGTVIAFDYLRSQEASPALSRIGEIHLVTLGSPLTHLYAYYFDEYQRPVAKADLRGNVASWTNFWRIDDPIGNRVDVVADNFIDNRPLGRGGHVDYWREDAVRRHILSLIEGGGTAPAVPAARRPVEPFAAWT